MRKDVLAKCYGGDISAVRRKLSGKTEGRKEANASGGKCRNPTESIYECTEAG